MRLIFNSKIFKATLYSKNQLQHVIVCNCTLYNACTVKPLITNTSEEFIKCRLDNFSMSFILYYVNFSICENK